MLTEVDEHEREVNEWRDVGCSECSFTSHVRPPSAASVSVLISEIFARTSKQKFDRILEQKSGRSYLGVPLWVRMNELTIND